MRFIRTTADVVETLAEAGVLTDAAAYAARENAPENGYRGGNENSERIAPAP